MSVVMLFVVLLVLAGPSEAGEKKTAAGPRQPAVIEVVISIITPDHLVKDFTASLKANLKQYLQRPVGRKINGQWLLLVTESSTGEKPTLVLSVFSDREGGGLTPVDRLPPEKLANPAVAGKFAALRAILVIRDEVRWQEGRKIQWQIMEKQP